MNATKNATKKQKLTPDLVEQMIVETLYVADLSGVEVNILGVDREIGKILGLCDEEGNLTNMEKRIRSNSGIIPIKVFGDIEGVCAITFGSEDYVLLQ